ncbi:hypothetical protein HPB47_007980 [Ixodes persulcatus]|uniref:Uncharacterized protein n=1 Tax=Ixodes persulcatus TaxID=34615 RepID=A0AC60P625_IXOPE|nr:hypothetical protein HPB47_007980 [Ixodes persulcatus]
MRRFQEPINADIIRIEGLKRALRKWRTVDIVLAVALICIMTLCAFGVFGVPTGGLATCAPPPVVAPADCTAALTTTGLAASPGQLWPLHLAALQPSFYRDQLAVTITLNLPKRPVGVFGLQQSPTPGRQGCFFTPAIPSVYEINETTNCISDGCRDFVGRFFGTIQPDVDPCQDFYAHVCGGWINTTDIPSDAVGIDVLSEAQMALNLEVMELRNSKGTKPLEKLLARLGIPRWPIVESNFQADVMGILANVTREIGVGALLSLRVGPDQTNNRRNVIYLDQPSFGVEHAILRARYRTPYFRILHRYKLYAYRCALLLGATVAAADLVNEIVGFEIRLAQDFRFVSDTIHELMDSSAYKIKWTFFLNRVLRDVPVMLDLTDKVMLRNQRYLRALSQLLQEESTYDELCLL